MLEYLFLYLLQGSISAFATNGVYFWGLWKEDLFPWESQTLGDDWVTALSFPVETIKNDFFFQVSVL